MTWTDFEFTPATGLSDAAEFPSKPVSGTAARSQFMTILNQIKAFFNGTVKTEIAASATAFKIGSFTRDMTLASGNQAITGVGFRPRFVLFIAANNAGTNQFSVGIDTQVARGVLINNGAASANTFILDASTGSIYMLQNGSTSHIGKINSFDADGFTIAWTKVASSTGTVTVSYVAMK